MTTSIATTQNKPSTKWFILTLAGITNAVSAAIPSMAMSVLFAEISADLQLTLTQVGIVWGIGSVTGIITSLLGGNIIDRFGPRKMLIFSTVFAGFASALRGLSSSFAFLVFTMLLAGLIVPLITMSGLKASRMWFPSHQLGASGGLLSMGMALGFFISSMFSASVISPWLGGWRNVFFFYGGLSLLLCIPWLLSPREPAEESTPAEDEIEVSAKPSLLTSLKKIASNPNNWLLAFVLLGLGGSVQAMLGYLPLYLRSVGWQPDLADNALATFHLVSLIMALPLSFISDRMRSKKRMVIVMMSMLIIGIGTLTFVTGPAVWGAVLFAGAVRDGFMAVYLAMVINARGVTPKLSATATGFAFLFSQTGNLIMPAMGNNIAETHPSMAFAFWAGFGLLSLIGFLFVKEKDPEAEMLPA